MEHTLLIEVHVPEDRQKKDGLLPVYAYLFTLLPPTVSDYYGDGTYVNVKENGRFFTNLDTRYLHRCGTYEGFRDFCLEWANDQFNHDGQRIVVVK